MIKHEFTQKEAEHSTLLNGQAKKIRIVSNNICYGPPPQRDEEIEQRGIAKRSAYENDYAYAGPG